MGNESIIGQGRTAEILSYPDGKILKLYREGFPEDTIYQEHQMSQLVYSLGINTAQPYEVINRGKRLGIVYDYIHGKTMLKLMLAQPWFIDRISKQMASLHWELHSRTIPEGQRPVQRMKAMLAYNIGNAPLLQEEEKQRIIRYLEGLPDDNKLCHGDFHPDNVLMGHTPCIIDWMTGTVGSPAGDASRTLLLLGMGRLPQGTPRFIVGAVSLLRKRLRNQYQKRYIELSGISLSEIERWTLPVAAARLVEWLPEEEKNQLVQCVRERLNDIVDT